MCFRHPVLSELKMPPCTLRAQNYTAVDEVRESCHIYECVMLHIWHDSFICVAWLIPMFGIPHSCMWHDPFKHLTWLTAAEEVRECVWVWVRVTFAKSQCYIWHAWQDKHQCYIYIYIYIYEYLYICIYICVCFDMHDATSISVTFDMYDAQVSDTFDMHDKHCHACDMHDKHACESQSAAVWGCVHALMCVCVCVCVSMKDRDCVCILLCLRVYARTVTCMIRRCVIFRFVAVVRTETYNFYPISIEYIHSILARQTDK